MKRHRASLFQSIFQVAKFLMPFQQPACKKFVVWNTKVHCKPDLFDAVNLMSKSQVLPGNAQLDSNLTALNSELPNSNTHLDRRSAVAGSEVPVVLGEPRMQGGGSQFCTILSGCAFHGISSNESQKCCWSSRHQEFRESCLGAPGYQL